ncbi:MAG: hypothetical protein WBB86_00655 [Candidatus Omnitrophota bacterium]
MMIKERLLAGLDELLHVEEEVVTLYANFSKAILKETEGVEEDKRKDIEKMLTRLYKDSSRHEKVIKDLIEQVEASAKNEY